MRTVTAFLVLAASAISQNVQIFKKKAASIPNQISFVNTCARDNGGFTVTSYTMSSCTGTGSLNHTAGNFLFVSLTFANGCAAGGTFTISNVAGDTWTAIDSIGNGAMCTRNYYVASTAGSAADNITFSCASCGSGVFLPALVVMQFSGINT